MQFIINIPADFRANWCARAPALLLEADATDPAATSNARRAESTGAERSAKDLRGPLASAESAAPLLRNARATFVQSEGITQYNIVPALMGVILTMTMVLMTGLCHDARARARDRRITRFTPALLVEVMTGKIIPYIMIGLVQASIIMLVARYIFHVPFLGSIALLYGVILIFIAANLTLGITFVTARNQLRRCEDPSFSSCRPSCFRVHVPLPRHAGLGAGDR